MKHLQGRPPLGQLKRKQGGFLGSLLAGAGLSLASHFLGRGAREDQARFQHGQLGIMDRQMDIAERQDERAEYIFDRYQKRYVPVEDRLIDSLDEIPTADEAAGAAGTDVAAGFDKAGEIRDRNLRRMGVNPNSGAYRGSERALEIERAKADTGARTGARRYVRDEKFRKLGTVASMGRGLPGTAAGFSGQAQAGLSDVATGYGRLATQAGNVAQGYGTAVGTGLGMIAGGLDDMWGDDT